jgi:GntR family transcriptional regulator
MENPPRQTSISFSLDPNTAVPTYMQIVNQVEDAIRTGYLHDGDQLPRVKDVVTELAINPNTVLKAYRELEVRKIATGRQGVGTFITTNDSPTRNDIIRQLVQNLRKGWLREAREHNLDAETIFALVKLAIVSPELIEER